MPTATRCALHGGDTYATHADYMRANPIDAPRVVPDSGDVFACGHEIATHAAKVNKGGGRFSTCCGTCRRERQRATSRAFRQRQRLEVAA